MFSEQEIIQNKKKIANLIHQEVKISYNKNYNNKQPNNNFKLCYLIPQKQQQQKTTQTALKIIKK